MEILYLLLMNYQLKLIMVSLVWFWKKKSSSSSSFVGMPAIILLYRGIFGKNVWTLNFRYNPLSNSSIEQNKVRIYFFEKKIILKYLVTRTNIKWKW
jgi:hypothetical protein